MGFLAIIGKKIESMKSVTDMCARAHLINNIKKKTYLLSLMDSAKNYLI